MNIDSYSYTNRGKYEINEDSVLCCGNIFAVADGLGGCDGGETASACAVDYFRNNYSGCSDEELEALIAGANKAVYGLGNGACTTMAAAFADGGKFRFTNIGDSRVYYFRKGKLLMRTKDHSVCQAAVEAGTMPEEEIRGSDDRSKLLRVLGKSGEIKTGKLLGPDGVLDGDAFIVCSDGFWEYVYETEMEIDLLKSGSAGEWAEYMLRRHLKRSRCEGDNFSVICGIIHAQAAAEKTEKENTEKTEAPAERKSLLVPIVVVGVFLIAAVLVFAYLISRSDRPGANVGAEPTVTENESGGETEEVTGETQETTEEPEESAGETQEVTGEPEESTGETQETTEAPEESAGETEDTTGESEESTKETQEVTEEPEEITESTERDTGESSILL